MTSIKDAAIAYEPKKMKNISNLNVIKTDVEFIENEKRKNSNDEEYSVSYFVYEGEEYRTPSSVLEQLKIILQSKPKLKAFKVNKIGEGRGTKYQVIPLE